MARRVSRLRQNGLPRSIRLASADAERFDLRLALSQVEINVTLDADAFASSVPPEPTPITLEELRGAGPLGASRRLDDASVDAASGRSRRST